MESKHLDSKEPELRIVLMGKTGAGKSASGNIILGKGQNGIFKEGPSASSVTQECSTSKRELNDQTLTVIDTPGMFNTKKGQKEVMMKIIQVLVQSSPGPHVFLWVVRSMTREAKESFEIFKKIFPEAVDYIFILHAGENTGEGKMGAYPSHVFDNKRNDDGQVLELVEKINDMVEKKNKQDKKVYYSSDLMKEAKAAVEQCKKDPASGDEGKEITYIIEKGYDKIVKMCPLLNQLSEIVQDETYKCITS